MKNIYAIMNKSNEGRKYDNMSLLDTNVIENELLFFKNLTPLNEELYNYLDKSNWETSFSKLSFKEWKTELETVGYDTARIMKNTNDGSLNQFFYVGDYDSKELMMLDPSWLTRPTNLLCLKADENGKMLVDVKDFETYFSPEWNLFSIDYFIRYYKEIDTSEIWKIFKLVNTDGIHDKAFPKNVLDYVFKYRQ